MKDKLTPLDGIIVFFAGAFLLISSNVLILACFLIFKGTGELGEGMGPFVSLIPVFVGEILLVSVTDTIATGSTCNNTPVRLYI